MPGRWTTVHARFARSRFAPIAALALVAISAVGCAPREKPAPANAPAGSAAPAPQPSGPKPHVLILVLDACRADKFGAYGFGRPTTPAFDALAAEPDSVLFRWQIAQAPHTRASTASLFTGVYPFQHGVFNEDDLTPELKKDGRNRYHGRKVAEGYETLAERLAAGGYRTSGWVGNPVIAGSDGFGQGFTTYVDPLKQKDAMHDDWLVEQGVGFLAAADEPGFAYVHTAGCHSPTPAETRDVEYWSKFGADFDERALRRAGVDPGAKKFKFLVRDGKVKLDAKAVSYVEAVYEAVLARVDREIVARTIDELKRAGIYERTLLAVTADHGEELYDHGGIAHGRTVWNEVLRIPLVVKFPKGAKPGGLGTAIERVTQTIDLYPGILRAAGLPPNAAIAGHDPFDSARASDIAYSQAPGLWSILEFPVKVIVSDRERRAELYDLSNDPKEMRDLAAERGDDLRRLVRLGETLQKALPKLGATLPESELELDPEMLEQLRSLGYIQ